MIKYEYKKVTGYDQKKFIENGHTMFEEDVLQRLKRLAHLEEQVKNNVVLPDVISCFTGLSGCKHEKDGYCRFSRDCKQQMNLKGTDDLACGLAL